MNRRLVAFSFVAFVVTAIMSYGFFHVDEHEQILEFVGLKLGVTPRAILPWELGAEVRPWAQPAIYFVIAKICRGIGVESPFTIAAVFRLLSSMLAWVALMRLTRVGENWIARSEEKRTLWRVTCTLGFLPYLAARTSSENLSASCIVMAFSLIMQDLLPSERMSAEGLTLAPLSAFFAGAFLGGAFEFRYQSAFFSVGLILWLIAIARAPVRVLGLGALGILCSVVAGSLADFWGYGHFVFVPYRYFTVNLVEGVANQFGTAPVYGYLYLMVSNIFAPIVIIAIVAMVLAWARNPKHALTWTTLPFVLAHSLVSHKEERFLFPLAPFVPLILVLAFAPRGASADLAENKWIARLWALRTNVLGKVLIAWNFAGLALLAFYPLNWNCDTDFYRFAYRHIDKNATLLTTLDRPFENHPFYRPGGFTATHVTESEFAAAAQQAPEKAYFVWREPHTSDDGGSLPSEVHEDTMVFSQFPGWQYPWIRSHVMRPYQAWVLSERTQHHFLPRYSWLELYEVPKVSSTMKAQPQ